MLDQVKALTFDVFGTVVDWRGSITREGEALARSKNIHGVDWAKFAEAWRALYQPMMQEVRSGRRPWTKLDDLHRMNLDRVLRDFSITGLSRFARWLADAAVVVVIAQTQPHEFDAGRCAQNMMVAAWNDGIGSCPAHLPEADLGKLLGIPAGVVINRVIGFGYVDPGHAAAPPSVARRRLPLDTLVHWETW